MHQKRQELILELLDGTGFVNAQDLAAQFNVTMETIRRDLKQMEQDGALRRIHGGAVSIRSGILELAYQRRQKDHAEEKHAIASVAAGMVNEGDTIIIAPGTTTLEVARCLHGKKDVTVITNSLPIAMDLADCEGLSVFCLGGVIHAADYSVSGVMSQDNLKMFNASKLITGVGGLTVKSGLTDYRMDESVLLRTFIDSVDCVIGIADRSKFGKVLRYNICPASMLTHLITDSGTPKELYLPYVEAGIQVHIAPPMPVN